MLSAIYTNFCLNYAAAVVVALGRGGLRLLAGKRAQQVPSQHVDLNSLVTTNCIIKNVTQMFALFFLTKYCLLA